MIILSPICRELEEFIPHPYYFLQMEAEKKKQKIDHKEGMWKNGKPPIVPGECVFVALFSTEGRCRSKNSEGCGGMRRGVRMIESRLQKKQENGSHFGPLVRVRNALYS